MGDRQSRGADRGVFGRPDGRSELSAGPARQTTYQWRTGRNARRPRRAGPVPGTDDGADRTEEPITSGSGIDRTIVLSYTFDVSEKVGMYLQTHRLSHLSYIEKFFTSCAIIPAHDESIELLDGQAGLLSVVTTPPKLFAS